MALPPELSEIPWASSSRVSEFEERSLTATSKPSFASLKAIPLPIPCAAPVTSATLPRLVDDKVLVKILEAIGGEIKDLNLKNNWINQDGWKSQGSLQETEKLGAWTFLVACDPLVASS